MIKDIEAMHKELGRQEPNIYDFIYSISKFSENPLSKDELTVIVDGGLIERASLEDHQYIEKLKKVFSKLKLLVEMDGNLDINTVESIYSMISSKGFRKSNPIIKEYNYIPVLAYELEDSLRLGLRAIEDIREVLFQAISAHNLIIEVHPFCDKNRDMAIIAMHYYLMKKGYPLPVFIHSPDEYREELKDYLLKKNPAPLYKAVQRAVFNKLAIILQEG